MANQSNGFSRLAKAAGYSWRGIRAAWRYEAAFRQEALMVIIAIIIACWLNVGMISRVLLIASVLLVAIIELLNSAIEAAIDRISPEWHELSGRAKDMGSAAVLLSLLLALITWVGLLWHYFTDK